MPRKLLGISVAAVLFIWAAVEYQEQRRDEARMLANGITRERQPTAFGQEVAVALACLGFASLIVGFPKLNQPPAYGERSWDRRLKWILSGCVISIFFVPGVSVLLVWLGIIILASAIPTSDPTDGYREPAWQAVCKWVLVVVLIVLLAFSNPIFDWFYP